MEKPDAAHHDDVGQADARAELDQLARELREAVLHVLWRQWRVLGARSASWRDGVARPVPTLVDPEALVLISLVLIDDEPRLADVMRDWVALNADVLGVQRLKNLSEGYFGPDSRVLSTRLAWLAATAGEKGGAPRWHALAMSRAAVAAPGSEESSPVPPPVTRRAKRTDTRSHSGEEGAHPAQPRFPDPASLMLRLRLGFGVGVKADMLAFLLAQSERWSTIRQIAGATGYTVAAARRCADDLVAAGLLSIRPGQPASYGCVVSQWKSLLGLDPDLAMRWGYWHERFQVTADFLQWAAAAQKHPLSPYAAGAHGRALLERHRGAFARDDFAPWSSDVIPADGVSGLRDALLRFSAQMQQDS